jgi:hypothetical protein
MRSKSNGPQHLAWISAAIRPDAWSNAMAINGNYALNA